MDVNVENVAENIAEIAAKTDEARHPHPGIFCLGCMLGAADATATKDGLIRFARRQGLRARVVGRRRWGGLTKIPLPSIAWQEDECFVVLAKIAHKKALVQDRRTALPEVLFEPATIGGSI